MRSRYTLLNDPFQSHTTSLTKNLNALAACLRSLLASARSRPLPTLGYTLGALIFVHYVSLLTGLPLGTSVSKATEKEGLSVDVLGESFGGDSKPNPSTPHAPFLGGFHYKDLHPLSSVRPFLIQAEHEIAHLNLATCKGQLGWEMVQAYNSTLIPFCAPPPAPLATSSNSPPLPTHSASPTSINCTFNHASPSLSWWPYPQSFCFSQNLLLYPQSLPGTSSPPPSSSSPSSAFSPPSSPDDDHLAPYPTTDRRRSTHSGTSPPEPEPAHSFIDEFPPTEVWRPYRYVGCRVGEIGEKLRVDMEGERFLGSEVKEEEVEEGGERCEGGTVGHDVLFVGRQDQWNPYHFAEDLVTTYLAMILGGLQDPLMATSSSRLQLVFTDEFDLNTNRFTDLWDRIGTYPPRRLSLDPFKPKTCLSRAVHSVGAGASLLSAINVGKPYTCASSLVWAASHYYRHLFGLSSSVLPSAELTNKRRPINVLWLSRAQMEAQARKNDDWSSWRETRHILNEPQLLARLRSSLKNLCQSVSSDTGRRRCRFSDVEDEPERWSMGLDGESWDGEAEDGEREVRFGVIDPVVHALPTQIDLVGHTSILVSLHGGALGLSLFLPPGLGSIIELQSSQVEGNYHFLNMAKQMGHSYTEVPAGAVVPIDDVWDAVHKQVMLRLHG